MAISQASVDALEKALSTGTLSVDMPEVGRVTYRSIGEIIEAIAYAKQQIGVSAGSTSQSFASFDKD